MLPKCLSIFILLLLLICCKSQKDNVYAEAYTMLSRIEKGRNDNISTLLQIDENGNRTKNLRKSGTGSIYIQGSDIYIPGYEVINKNRVAKYWKNGRSVFLSGGHTHSYATGVSINNKNVFVSGTEKSCSGVYRAVYWKDDRKVFLSDSSTESIANGIFISRGQLFAVGYRIAKNGNEVAVLWTKNKVSYLSDSVKRTSANSVFVWMDTLYVVGTEDKPQTVA